MVTVSHALPINPPDEVVRLSRDDVWRGLIAKAEDPVQFVPAITACTILERHGDTLLREIELRGERMRERVTVHPKSHVVFERTMGSVLGRIVNQIEERAGDELWLRFTLQLTVTGTQPGGPQERAQVETNRDSYVRAVEQTLRVMRQTLKRGPVSPGVR